MSLDRVMVTAVVTVIIQGLSRSTAAAMELLGNAFGGIVVSDRFSVDNLLPLERRQICWAHVIRDLTAIAERPGASVEFGAELLKLQRQLFAHWHRYKQGAIDWPSLQQACGPIRQSFEATLRRVVELGHPSGERTPWAKTVGTCNKLLPVADGLWTFLKIKGIEPTNNAAERALRQSLIQHKPWRPIPPGRHLPQPPAHRHHHVATTGPRCLAIPGAGVGCPSPQRGDAITAS